MLGGRISGALVGLLIASVGAPVALAEEDPDDCVWTEFVASDSIVGVPSVKRNGDEVVFLLPTAVPDERGNGFKWLSGVVSCVGDNATDLVDCLRGASSREQIEGCV